MIPVILLGLFFGLSFGAMTGDAAIVDELAHVPAAYSYDHYGDYRVNAEHPPLMKNLAGWPLQFLHLNFPSDTANWNSTHPEQYTLGYDFLYHYGNSAAEILFWARLPLLIFATFFGYVFYEIIRRRYNLETATLGLFFYALSPNFIAHSHYVATDVGASIGMFVALAAFIRLLEHPSRRSVVVLSLALGFAELTKFSSILLYTFMLIAWIAIALLGIHKTPWRLLKGIMAASLLSIVWIYIYYIPNTIALTGSLQSSLFDANLMPYMAVDNGIGPWIAKTAMPLTQFEVLRPLLQYILGLAMVIVRVGSGNVTYFNGMVALTSFPWYFPEIFVLKTQISFLILLLISILSTVVGIWRLSLAKFGELARRHYFEIVMTSFAAYYFITAVMSNLNIGIRHILPIYPPLFAVVAIVIVRLVYRLRQYRGWAVASLVVLMVWYGANTIQTYPSYVAYFNGLAGGPAMADKYFSDSGVDWGQDLIRLKKYTDKHPEISVLALDYFGGGTPPDVFCKHVFGANGKRLMGDAGLDCSHTIYREWHAGDGRYTGQYIAVSETYLMNDMYYSGVVYSGSYDYLRQLIPIARIGNSIYLYKLY